MFRNPPRESQTVSWLLFLAWTLSIYTAIPFARSMQGQVNDLFGSGIFLPMVGVYLGCFLLYAVYVCIRSLGRQSILRVGYLLLIASAFAYWMWQLRENPERTLHFVQYGTLSLFAYRALLHQIRNPSIYPASALLCGICGTIDEIIQWLTPERVFDYNDIAINFGAAILVQLALVLAIRPALIQPGLSVRGVKLLTTLFSIFLLLLGLCLSNTPQRVVWYTEKIPSLSFLRDNPILMAEYGYPHTLESGVKFYSRFRLRELEKLDKERGKEIGSLLAEWKQQSRYGEFLRTYPAHTYPLEYEVRVRLFRMIRHRNLARKQGLDGERFIPHARAAYIEHLLLSTHYPTIYAHSDQTLPKRQVEILEQRLGKALQTQGDSWESPVSSQMITRVTLQEIWLGILLALFSSYLFRRYYCRKAGKSA